MHQALQETVSTLTVSRTMDSRQIGFLLWLSIIMVCCCCHQIWAGRVELGTKAKFPGSSNKKTNQTIKHLKAATNKSRATINSTTNTPAELATTTMTSDFDLDGRSAFINNEFVADTEDESSPLQTQTSLATNDGQVHDHQDYDNDSSQKKEALNNDAAEVQKLYVKPTFGYKMEQLDDDYEEEEANEYGSESENSQESMADDDAGGSQLTYSQKNVEPNIFELSFQNKPFDSAANDNTEQNDYDPTESTQQHSHKNNNNYIARPEKISQPAHQYNPQNNYGSKPPSPQHHHHQQQQSLHSVPSNQDVQSKPLQHYGLAKPNPSLANQNSYDISNSQTNQQQHPFIIRKTTPQHLLNSQKPMRSKQQLHASVNKPQTSQNSNNQPLHKNYYNNAIDMSTLLNESNNNASFNTLTASANPSHNTSSVETSSPFSSTSGRNKKFKTVSSSIQYVATPFADFVLKYSVGMARRLNGKMDNNFQDNQRQIFNVANTE